MINELISIFDKAGDIDQIVKDNYALKKGLYIEIDESGDILNHLFVEKESDKTDELYQKFKDYDFYSNWISPNKSLSPVSKRIHSNNYLTVFFKYETLEDKSVLMKYVEKYYETVLLLKDCPKEAGDMKAFYEKEGEAFFEKIDDMVKEYEKTTTVKPKEFYIKIFKSSNLDIYKQEFIRYCTEKIFVDDSNLITVGEEILGPPSFDTTYNDKKAFLVNVTTPFQVANRMSVNDSIKLYMIRTWIQSMSTKWNEIYIPFDYDFKSDPVRVENKPCIYFKVTFASAEPEILDSRLIQSKQSVATIIQNNYMDIKDLEIKALSIDEVRVLMSRKFFENEMRYNRMYLIDDDSKLNKKLKHIINMYEDALLEWFDGNESLIRPVIDKMTASICSILFKETYNSSIYIYRDAYNLRFCLLDYFKKEEEETFMNQFKTIYETIKESIYDRTENNSMTYIENDETFYYAAGQLIYYILNQSEAKEKTLNGLNPFISATSIANFKRLICQIIKTYGHKLTGRRFEALCGAVMNYESTKAPVNMTDYLVAGYFAQNILFLKTKKNDEEVEINE